MKKIIVSDIHSNIEVLKNMGKYVPEWEQEDYHIIFAGDYIDGFYQEENAGLEVLKEVKRLCEQGKATAIMGNHDMFLKSVIDKELDNNNRYINLKFWLQNGGESTLNKWAHLNVKPKELKSDINKLLIAFENNSEYFDLVEWIKTLPLIAQADNLLVVHAGFNMSKSIDSQYENDLLWIREKYLVEPLYTDFPIHKDFFNKVIVSGHTPNQTLSNTALTRYEVNSGDIIESHIDKYSIKRYFIDAGSKGSPIYNAKQLNVLILDDDNSLIRKELIKLT